MIALGRARQATSIFDRATKVDTEDTRRLKDRVTLNRNALEICNVVFDNLGFIGELNLI